VSSGSHERVALRTCPLCEATCGLSIALSGDRVLRITGDEQDVFSKGYLCPKGTTLGDLHTDPDRLRGPVVKRNGVFVPVGWDEAFSEVARLFRPLLADPGPDCIGVYLGNPIGHNLSGLIYPRVFLKALRSRNLYTASTLDQRPKDLSNALLYGERYTLAVPDIDRTQFMVVLGANPMVSNGSLATAPGWPRRLKALVARGGRLVVIDPVRTLTAELAHQHIAPRVGTDAALLLAMVHVLFDEGLVRMGRLTDHVHGVEELQELAQPFNPERLAAYTGVACETVRTLTRAFAASSAACIYGRIGTTATRFGSISSWLIDAINVLTGNLDRIGGAMFPMPATGSANTRGRPGQGRGFVMGRHHTRVRRAPELFGELPTSCLAEEIDTPGSGRYRGLLLVGGNPVVSAPSSARLDAALPGLDAIVAIDPYINDTTRHAHVILPPPSPLQRSHYDLHFTQWSVQNVAKYSPAPLPLEPGQLDEWQIMCRLASAVDGSNQSVGRVDERLVESIVRAGVQDESSVVFGVSVDRILEQLAPRTGPERILDYMLRVGPYGDGFGQTPSGLTLEKLQQNPHGIDLGPMEPRLPEVLRSGDGKIHLAPSLLMQDVGRLRLDIDVGPATGLQLVGRRHVRSNNSWMHNIPSLMTGKERCTLMMHPVDAQERDLQTGATACVTTTTGEIQVVVQVSDRMARGVVSLPHGWLHDGLDTRLSTARLRPGANSNRLADGQAVDRPSWTSVLNGFPVEVHALTTQSQKATQK
jgi:anaerobic selenocysteine-containing dehydrogenase